ncbi:uncharacterized protein LOC129950807 [Eupeodes corollae]|uniref:uncharacterized protein LOC129950807 n=1 Tax=Eupeodes corollae TaxID=290404 RepID=UPI002490C681|nr:uncharacterized protein LOC129950807 [Eupeodes corollae]
MDDMSRILFLLNASSSRDLTDAEQEFFDENYGRVMDEEVDEGERVHENNSEDDDSDDGADFSDADDPNYEPNEALLDLRVQQVGFDMEEEAEVELQRQQGTRREEEVESEPANPNRGMRYTARNMKFNDIWWSMPDEIEKRRANRDRNERLIHGGGTCSKTFSSKADCFKSLVTPAIVENIVLETNRKAKRVYEENRLSNEPKVMRRWYDTTEDEIFAYIAILLYAGAEKAYGVEAKDLFHESNMAFYRAVMSLERFEQISRFIRFDDGRSRTFRLQSDKLAAFRHVWNLFQSNLISCYQPSKELTIDEQLVGTRGRCPFKMYMPNKPGKYGVKIFWIVDAKTNYPLQGEIYVGQQPGENRSEGISHQLVMRLAEKYLDKGYNITTDNYFTSVPLALNLMTRKTTTVGTIKSNKPQLPKLCKQHKKNVLMLSTTHHEDKIDEATQKPEVIIDYNSTKGGVDTLDRMVTVYTCKRKTNRWPVTVFYNLLDCAGVAAYRLFDICQPTWYVSKKRSDKRKRFLKELALELAAKHLQNRIAKTTLQTKVKTAMKLIGYEIQTVTMLPTSRPNTLKQRCEVCKVIKKDNKTTAVCDLCYTATCTKHYVRVCEKYYVAKDGHGDEDEDGGTFLPSTSAGQSEKRRRTHSPT